MYHKWTELFIYMLMYFFHRFFKAQYKFSGVKLYLKRFIIHLIFVLLKINDAICNFLYKQCNLHIFTPENTILEFIQNCCSYCILLPSISKHEKKKENTRRMDFNQVSHHIVYTKKIVILTESYTHFEKYFKHL